MKVIVLLSWLLLTLCLVVLAKFDISPQVRENLFNQTVWKRYEVIDEYLYNKCDETTALDFLRHYVFNRVEWMTNFVEDLKDCETPTKNNHKLLNPDYYEKLRFNSHIESWLSKKQAIQRIYDIYTLDELSFINISLLELYDDYFGNNLFDTVTFDDYYAIKTFLSNPKIVDYSKRIHCRIMKAMYRLIIRQYDAVNNTELIMTTLYCPVNYWTELTVNIDISKLTICSEDSSEMDRIMNSGVRIQHQKFTFKAYFKIEFFQLNMFVHLKNVVEHRQQYVILPGTFVQLNDFETFLVEDEPVNVAFLKASMMTCNKILAFAANLAVKCEIECPTPSSE